jgi:hypothetical protein
MDKRGIDGKIDGLIDCSGIRFTLENVPVVGVLLTLISLFS